MARHYTRHEVLARIEALTDDRLDQFVTLQAVVPVQTPQGPGYAEGDLARLHLLSDLDAVMGLPEDAVEMVMALIDQLNTARGDMRALIHAVAAEPDEVRLRIRHSVHTVRVVDEN